jgi:transcriptional regulator with XRE-family HTH domain
VALSKSQEQEKSRVQQLFGQRLAKLRNERGITQEKFSFALKVDRTYVSYIERGERNPSLYLLWRMAKVLKISLSKLLDI